MARPELLVLNNPIVATRNFLTYAVGAVANNDTDLCGFQGLASRNDVLNKRAPGELMEHFWKRGTHTGTLPGGEDNNS